MISLQGETDLHGDLKLHGAITIDEAARCDDLEPSYVAQRGVCARYPAPDCCIGSFARRSNDRREFVGMVFHDILLNRQEKTLFAKCQKFVRERPYED